MSENIIKLKFPNEEIEKEFKAGSSIVMLGANGAGKTRLSVKIEELNDLNYSNYYRSDTFHVLRIGAQKSLNIKESFNLRNIEVAEEEAYNGKKYSGKYSCKYYGKPSTHLIDDYSESLSLLFAKNNVLMEEFYKKSREADLLGNSLPSPQKSLLEIAEEIWRYLLPKRQIDLSGNNVYAKMEGSRYYGSEMSDGERVILYMIVQVLCAKEGSLIIIDEPELHIHKAIINKLWDRLEEVRQDCVFMYVTHDLDFAVSRNAEEVLWVKLFEGVDKWDYEFIEMSDYINLPQGLLFEMMGTQKKILFVEGTKDSLDYLIYQEVLKDKDYHIIPCGSCSQVINNVRAKKGYSQFNHIDVKGIIDRDYRTENEIQVLKKDGIFVLEDVAEVENLFIVPELLHCIKEHLGQDETIVKNIKQQVTNIFNGQKNKQITNAFLSEVKHQLSTLDLDGAIMDEEVVNKISSKFSQTEINKILEEKSTHFNGLNSYEDIIRYFNFKEIVLSFDSILKLNKGEYKSLVIRLLKKSSNPETKNKIIQSIEKYLPKLEEELVEN